MTAMVRVAAALILGLLAAFASSGLPEGWTPAIGRMLEPLGTLWVNAIRMTVLPLIVALLVVGIASTSDTGRLGRLGVRAVITFYAILSVVAALIALVAPAAFAGLRLDPVRVAALRASVAGSIANEPRIPSFHDWLVGLVPTNAFRAAADGAMLPLIVFTVAFAFAMTRVEPSGRQQVVGFFRAVKDAMLVLAGWVFLLAPVGVFALAFALGIQLGTGAVGALGYYILVQVGLHAAVIAGLYAFAVMRGGVGLRQFAAAAAPAQIVGLSTRSSLAAVPAMIEGTTRTLGLPAELTGFVLPLSVSVFKLTSPINWTVGAVFVSRLYGIELGAAQIATVAVLAVALSPTSPGIPSGGLLSQAPVYATIGLPVEGIGILIAVDLVPDLFKTLVNVTGDMAATTVIGRSHTVAKAVPQ
jgi:Na+/H+-dicarboxylate symporter